ncbi:hypothetical protein [Phenylobacterium sp. J367]|uniref:hypothetical protein n=1 Tax=Phenylobacterium sp. J367 TaxID=2898435 RepID=UPI002150BA0B|nr:hypothetical protein [Phenylobacterium sp. J367]MCR5880316.1 hypothetical protein [Phenylobacterium sp. J367]
MAIGAPAAQAILGFGQSASEFSAGGDQTLRAAGYAFSIWTPIYLGMIAFTIYQLLPRNDGSGMVALTAPYGGLAFLSCGIWILLSAWDAEWMTVLVILTGLFSALTGMTLATRVADAPRRDIFFCAWPLAALAGWLTVAAPLNILTVMTSQGLIGEEAAVPAALSGLAVAAALAIFTLRQTHLWLYAVPVAWGLAAVAVAERSGKPLVAGVAVVLAVGVLLAAWLFRRPTAAPR